ncbi:MAG: RNA polymerase factor sigma-54 [Planctomycetes bacterium]|nr:RNA polymerase factor sigma-54 [Planctomycetota bacterium]
MKIGLHQSARLEQRLMQSPQMIQAMQILQLGALELESRIEQELLENPVLELADSVAGGPESPEEGGGPGEASNGELEANNDRSDMFDAVESMEWEFGDGQRSRGESSADADSKYEAMQNTPAGPQHMAEALAEEWIDLDLNEEDRTLMDFLLWSLDEHGYLRQGVTRLAEQMQAALGKPVDRMHLADILARLRKASHPALGARDLQDCLALQLEAQQNPDPLLWNLIENHLEDIQKNRLPAIAKATGASIEEIKVAMETLRHLDPFPGTDFGGEPATTITPDILVEEQEGQFMITLARGRAGQLAINDDYTKMLTAKGAQPEVKTWVRKHVEQAQWFIDALQQRLTTLERVAQRVFSHQEPFLREGLEGLRPLRMQEVADELGVHISTISRTVAGKYAQTPQGIFPLKFFFTGGMETDSGAEASQAHIQEQVRQLIAGEDKKRPLSDEAIAKLLADQNGIQIARRTVTKYRKALGLASSSGRKEY